MTLTKRKRAKYWVLRNCKGLYFRDWTCIGPRSTNDIDRATRFQTRRDAERSDAMSYALETYKPEAVR